MRLEQRAWAAGKTGNYRNNRIECLSLYVGWYWSDIDKLTIIEYSWKKWLLENRISSSKFGIVYSADPEVEDDRNSESLAGKWVYPCID
jgi:hypothetical protein